SDGPVAEGSVGAGTGATIGKLFGRERAMKGGIGSFTVALPGGVLVSALCAVNALGDVCDPATGKIVAGARTSAGSREFADSARAMLNGTAIPGETSNTTLAVIATNAALDKVQSTKLAQLAGSALGIVLAVPGYFQPRQAEILRRVATPLPVLGSVPALLAAAIAGHAEQFWERSVLVVDVDEHALTLGWVKSISDKAHLIESRSFTNLGLRFFSERILNALADLCVRQHRRDPRDIPQAEQSLYDQLDVLTEAALKHQAIQLGIQAPQWFKHLLVHPEEIFRFCHALTHQAALEIEHLLAAWPATESPRCILLTQSAGRLPGLLDLVRTLVLPSAAAETRLPANNETNYHDEDLVEDLMFNEVEDRIEVMVLSGEAPARAAHGLAELFRTGAVPRGHLETIAPLPAAPPVDAGPPRLHFQGRDHLLREASCTLGSYFGCPVCFDKAEHPEVAPRHCDITWDGREFTLHNRCREGTLVNDHPVSASIVLRPGDSIRLGARGPIVRFFGRARASTLAMPTKH
ncbi:MAG: P1 family peptidase, partial [Planctomycetes bacterium]|nr:P1 family peptidase [Planctomycetota bacterium]